jgi:ABC-type bacteriocin/lantibiotic exporter with double-glycine peptidase domain
LITSPNELQDNQFLRWTSTVVGSDDWQTLLVVLGLGVLFAFVSTNIIIAVTQWMMFKFSWGIQYRLSLRLFVAYLGKPYVAYLNKNSADANKNVLSESQFFATNVIAPAMQAFTFGISAILIIGFLFWVSPVAASIVGAVLGGGYGLFYLGLRRTLLRVGQKRTTANMNRFKATAEAFGGIKEIKATGREDAFIAAYELHANEYASTNALEQILALLPRYLIEILALGSMLLLILRLIVTGTEASTILPLASVYAIGGLRLMPAMQALYGGVSHLRFAKPVVDALYVELLEEEHAVGGAPRGTKNATKLVVKDKIELKDVTFTYPSAERSSVESVSLIIPHGSSIAFVGETGAGKTTIADVIVGLLRPQKGSVTVDGQELNDSTLPGWQRNLGYVPQQIYLADESVTRNIAFGVPEEMIDQTAVEQAARIANIHDFVTIELPNGYDTLVGEQGVRLSGGQRQRIGIARALYYDPEVLVLDEATSALDGATEQEVQDAINQINATKCMVFIAHRLSTVRDVPAIYVMEGGRIVAHGTYDELAEASPHFRALAQLNS